MLHHVLYINLDHLWNLLNGFRFFFSFQYMWDITIMSISVKIFLENSKNDGKMYLLCVSEIIGLNSASCMLRLLTK